MTEEDVAGELIPPGDAATTDGFQLQLGPDGRCRLVLFGDDDAPPLAVLELSAAAGDRLAQELAQRRDAYDKARRQQQRGRAQ